MTSITIYFLITNLEVLLMVSVNSHILGGKDSLLY